MKGLNTFKTLLNIILRQIQHHIEISLKFYKFTYNVLVKNNFRNSRNCFVMKNINNIATSV